MQTDNTSNWRVSRTWTQHSGGSPWWQHDIPARNSLSGIATRAPSWRRPTAIDFAALQSFPQRFDLASRFSCCFAFLLSLRPLSDGVYSASLCALFLILGTNRPRYISPVEFVSSI